HMHSDFFDLMVLAGISGVFFWIYYMVNLWVAIRRAVLEVFDRVLAINILVCIFILSLMTGQMYFPTTMCYQLCSLFSILMLSDKDFFKKNEMQTEELCYANQLPRR
ncbi:MAG: hypothetical protein PHI35_05180, partial [Victivallaceae bacterium]|nr:hypothetical protein [Victivallaceae bacterium]